MRQFRLLSIFPKKVKWYTWDSKIGSGIIVVYTWYFLNITLNKHISLLILWFLGGRGCPVICPTVIIYITNWHFWAVKISFIPLDCSFNSPSWTVQILPTLLCLEVKKKTSIKWPWLSSLANFFCFSFFLTTTAHETENMYVLLEFSTYQL